MILIFLLILNSAHSIDEVMDFGDGVSFIMTDKSCSQMYSKRMCSNCCSNSKEKDSNAIFKIISLKEIRQSNSLEKCLKSCRKIKKNLL